MPTATIPISATLRTMLNRLSLGQEQGGGQREDDEQDQRRRRRSRGSGFAAAALQKECRADCVKPPLSSLSAVVSASSTSSKFPAGAGNAAHARSSLRARPQSVSTPTIILTISSGVVSLLAADADDLPAPQHQDAVGDREDVAHVVADHDHRGAARLQLQDQVEDLARFLDAERGGRLVHDDDAAVLRGGAADGDRLALAAGQLADFRR